MREMLVVVVLSAACGGSKPAPAPPKPNGPTGPTPPVTQGGGDPKKPEVAKPAAGKFTCTTAAAALVKERGFGKIPTANQERARRAGEAEAEAACLDGQWETAAIECMSTRPSAASCLGQLDEYQQHAYETHFADWELNWTKGIGARASHHDDDDDDDADTKTGKSGMDDKPAREEWIACEVGDIGSFEPILPAKAPDRDYQLKLRKTAVLRSCEYKWSNTDKKCFTAASGAAAVKECRGKLDTAGQNAIGNSIADADVKFARVVKLSKDARLSSCKAIAATYYSGDVTNMRLTSLAPGERARVINESRDKLAAACTADKWKATERACVSLATNEYAMTECFQTGGYEKAFKFRLPAAGVIFKVGIPECDELGEQIKKLSTCDKMEKELRDMLVDGFSMQLGGWVEVRASDRAEIAEMCKDAGKRYIDKATRSGCKL